MAKTNEQKLAEIMQKVAEMQRRENGKKLPDEQIRAFVSDELDRNGNAKPDSAAARYLGGLLARNPKIRQELKEDLPAARQARKLHMARLRADAARRGAEKLKQDLLGRKKRAAQRELEQIAQKKRDAAGKERLDASALNAPDSGRDRHWYTLPARPLTALVNRTALGTHAQRHIDIPFDQKLPCNPIEHRTKSGVLRGAEFEPIGEPNGKVVLFFSGSGSPAARYVQPVLEPYLLMGAKVVTMDYRGFGKSETLTKTGKKTGTPLCEKSMYEDGREMLDFVTKTMGVKPENVILHGFSMGGPVASKVAADFAQEQQRTALAEGRKLGAAKLGGIVLHSPTNSMYEVAKAQTNAVMGFGGWVFGGGYNAASHMQRLHKFDPEMPVHYVSGDYNAEQNPDRETLPLPEELQDQLEDAYRLGEAQRYQRQRGMSEEAKRQEKANLDKVRREKQEDDLYDGLDIYRTHIHEDPEAQFENATAYRGKGAHTDANLSYYDNGLRSLVQGRRAPEPQPRREPEPGPENA